MVDFLGNELNVGDEVVVTVGTKIFHKTGSFYANYLRLGVIERFTKSMVVLKIIKQKDSYRHGDTRRVSPCKVVKVE